MAQKISFDIKEEILVLSQNAKGWQKELNLVSWNDHPPKFDLREWSPEHDKMSKGITLTNEEMKKLTDFLKESEFM